MTRELGSRWPAVVASGTFVLGVLGVAIALPFVVGNNPNYFFVPLLLLAPSALAAGGTRLTRTGTTAFRFAGVCCAFVCFGSLLVVLAAGAEVVAPTDGFAVAGAVGIGWFIQILPATVATVAGLVAWIRRMA